jgi:hypothetical protein
MIQRCPNRGEKSDLTADIMRPLSLTGDTEGICQGRDRAMPEMVYVDSSNIEAVGYDAEGQELHVQFLSSGYYIYHGVPEEVFDGLMYAPSKGSYLNREVKGVFEFTKQ